MAVDARVVPGCHLFFFVANRDKELGQDATSFIPDGLVTANFWGRLDENNSPGEKTLAADDSGQEHGFIFGK